MAIFNTNGQAIDVVNVDPDVTKHLANTYSNASTYNIGDYVSYEGSLYKCKTAISTAEEWTSGHWDEVKVGDEISDLKGDLSDIGEPLRLDVVQGNSTSKKVVADVNSGIINNGDNYVIGCIDFNNFNFDETQNKVIKKTSNVTAVGTRGTFYLYSGDVIVSDNSDYVFTLYKTTAFASDTYTTGYTVSKPAQNISAKAYEITANGYYMVQAKYSDGRVISNYEEFSEHIYIVRKIYYNMFLNTDGLKQLPMELSVGYASNALKTRKICYSPNKTRWSLMPFEIPQGAILRVTNGARYNISKYGRSSSFVLGESTNWIDEPKFEFNHTAYYGFIIAFADNREITENNVEDLFACFSIEIGAILSPLTEDIPYENEFRDSELTYTTPRGNYRTCGLTYRTSNNKFYIVGGSTSKDGTARLFSFSDWDKPYQETLGVTLDSGHSNDMTYDPENDRLLIACGGTEGDEAQYYNKVAIVNPDTGVLQSRVTVTNGVHGIEYIDGYIYLRIHTSTDIIFEKRSLDLSTILETKTITKASVLAWLGKSDQDEVLYQGMAYNPRDGLLYTILSERRISGTFKYWTNGLLLGVSLGDYVIRKAMSFNVHNSEELEGFMFSDTFDYAVSDGYYVTYRRLNNITKINILYYIPPNSDLNDYISNGTYFSNNAANSATLENTPVDDNGFKLTVYNVTTVVKAQTVESNDGTIYKRIYNDPNTWSEWVKNGNSEETDIIESTFGIQSSKLSMLKFSGNLFSDFSNYVRGGYYGPTNGYNPGSTIRIVPTPNWQGWFIKVEPNTQYTCGPLDYQIVFYDNNLEYSEHINKADLSDSNPNTFTTNSKSEWVAITQRIIRDMSRWMLVVGATYPSVFTSGKPRLIGEPLPPRKKTIAFMGDSITAGSGTNKTFHEYIADKFGYTCLNYGYGGSGYVRNFPSTGGLIGLGNEGRGVTLTDSNKLTSNNVLARLAEIDKTAVDAVCIFAGTNDWAHGEAISVEQFETGIEAVFDYYQTNFERIPLIVITPIHRKNDTVPNANTNKTLSEYVDIIKAKCSKYGIPYIDAFCMSGLHSDNSGNDTAFYARDDNNQSDGLHPNHYAHERIASIVYDLLYRTVTYDD